jgi:hypothetical protein
MSGSSIFGKIETLCRKGNAEAALHCPREIMGKLKLTVDEDQTRICRVPKGEFDFLGLTFGRGIFAEDRPVTPGTMAIEEEPSAHGRNDP